LAYDKHYSHKMMLVFNKLSAEAGDDDVKIANYRASMMQALHPHKLDDFKVCFFDAKDYCEGVDEDEPELIELSRFEEFMQALDQFVKERDKLAQLDTPIRRVLGYAEETEQWYISQPQQDEMFNAALNRAAKKLRDGRNRFQLAVKKISLEVTEKVRAAGSNFANALPEMKNEADFQRRQKAVEIELEEIWTELETELQRQTEEASAALHGEIQEVFSSQFLSGFIPILDPDVEFDASRLPPGFDFPRLQQQMQSLQEIGASAGVNVAKLATRSTLGTARSGGATLRTIDVAGSSLHRGVYSVGKFVGFKFKPFGAIKVAKNLGNAAKFVGPLLGILTIGLEISDMAQQKKQADDAREAKAEIERQFTQ
ncbi:MAG: GTPase, partial [Oscillatoriales cyanobacterium]